MASGGACYSFDAAVGKSHELWRGPMRHIVVEARAAPLQHKSARTANAVGHRAEGGMLIGHHAVSRHASRRSVMGKLGRKGALARAARQCAAANQTLASMTALCNA